MWMTFGLFDAAPPVPVWRQISRRSVLCGKDFMVVKSLAQSLATIMRASWCSLSKDNEHRHGKERTMALKTTLGKRGGRGGDGERQRQMFAVCSLSL